MLKLSVHEFVHAYGILLDGFGSDPAASHTSNCCASASGRMTYAWVEWLLSLRATNTHCRHHIPGELPSFGSHNAGSGKA